MPAPANLKYRRKAANIELVGAPEVQALLKELGANHGKSVENRVAKKALAAGGKPLVKALKREAPKVSKTRTTGKRKQRPARMKTVVQSIGFRNKKNKTKNIHEAKGGVNVTKKRGKEFKQGHLFTMGTRRRRTKSGANRGVMPANRFVRTATAVSGAAVLSAMKFSVVRSIPLEVAKLRQKHQAKNDAAIAATQ